MTLDLVLSPFGAGAPELVEAARCAEDSGLRGVWTFDHLTAPMPGNSWSLDPFTALGAVAQATTDIRVGPLVANMMNRHPVQLALAMATLQSLSGGRAVLGLGAGASPGSRFGAEHEAIGTALLGPVDRRARLAETVAVVDALWRGSGSFAGDFTTIDDLGPVVGPTARPPVIIGVNGAATLDVALACADGVNLNLGSDVDALLDRIRAARPGPDFETTVLVGPGDDAARGVARWSDDDRVDGVIMLLGRPFDHDLIQRLGRLRGAGGAPRGSR